MTLEQAKRRAQDTADTEGRPVAVVNLNRFSATAYALRAYDGKPDGWAFVAFPSA